MVAHPGIGRLGQAIPDREAYDSVAASNARFTVVSRSLGNGVDGPLPQDWLANYKSMAGTPCGGPSIPKVISINGSAGYLLNSDCAVVGRYQLTHWSRVIVATATHGYVFEMETDGFDATVWLYAFLAKATLQSQ